MSGTPKEFVDFVNSIDPSKFYSGESVFETSTRLKDRGKSLGDLIYEDDELEIYRINRDSPLPTETVEASWQIQHRENSEMLALDLESIRISSKIWAYGLPLAFAGGMGMVAATGYLSRTESITSIPSPLIYTAAVLVGFATICTLGLVVSAIDYAVTNPEGRIWQALHPNDE